MQTSSGGFQPNKNEHIRQSELCATCHTLYTNALGQDGKVTGVLPEQMPYPEWLHSDYKDKKSCQSCHMPVILESVPITKVLGVPREGVSRHVFVGGNFFMQRMLNRYRDDLNVMAQPQELTGAADRTVAFLQTQSARVSISNVDLRSGRLEADVSIENLSGHKMPTAYPSRRAWLHFAVRDKDNRVVFESGALRSDGSIEGNDNDADPARYEPHYSEIRSSDQVQLYETIMRDPSGAVTTGLITAVGYLKDNRLLPKGFDKNTAEPDIAVQGDAVRDAAFTEAGHTLRYSVPLGGAQGPFHMDAELWYQPIGYRWANNLKKYGFVEPRRFNNYYDSMASGTGVILASATAVH
jgi:hypothetical protein